MKTKRNVSALQWALLVVTLIAVMLLLFESRAQNGSSDQDAHLTWALQYEAPQSGMVQLVWGIDGWQPVEPAYRPASTTIVENVMHTPMQATDTGYVARITVPVNAEVNFGFLTTEDRQGRSVSWWEEQPAFIATTTDTATATEPRIIVTRSTAPDAESSGAYWADRQELRVAVGIATAVGLLCYALFVRGLLSLSTMLLTLILLVAAVLRFNNIDQPYIDAFSWRQASTAMMAENFYLTNPNIFFPEVNWSGPGPNYQGREFQTVSYLAALLYRVFGQVDWVGRVIAMAFGLWGIFALYQLVARVWDRPRALTAAAFMAVIPGSVFIERSFLPDPAMVALITTSLWLLVVYLQTDRFRYLLLATLIGVWGCASKLPGLIIGLPMIYAAVAILYQRQQLTVRRTGLLVMFAVLALTPVIAYYLWARHLAETYPPHHFAGTGNWIWVDGFRSWFAQGYFLEKLIELLAIQYWTPVVLVLALFGLLLRPPAAQQPEKARWFFHWWLLAGAIYYLIGAKELLENPWNLHILAPPAVALAAHASITVMDRRYDRLWLPPMRIFFPAVVLVGLIWFGSRSLSWFYRSDAEDDYRLGLALNELAEPDDLVVTIGHTLGDPTSIYYSGRRGWSYPPFVPDLAWSDIMGDSDSTIAVMESLRDLGADWVGVAGAHREELWDRHPEFAAYLEQTSTIEIIAEDFVIFDLTPDDVAVDMRP